MPPRQLPADDRQILPHHLQDDRPTGARMHAGALADEDLEVFEVAAGDENILGRMSAQIVNRIRRHPAETASGFRRWQAAGSFSPIALYASVAAHDTGAAAMRRKA